MEGKYFSSAELSCSCCGVNKMKPETIARLDRLRELYGFPLVLSSAFRCPKHNAEVSSTGDAGPHTTGQAVDIVVRGAEGLTLMGIAQRLGFTGFGVKQHGGSRYLHLDDLPAAEGRPRPWLWSYP